MNINTMSGFIYFKGGMNLVCREKGLYLTAMNV